LRKRLEASAAQARPLRARTSPAMGAAHAKAFKMFGEGKDSRDVVIACELEAPAVVELRRQWAEMGGEFTIGADTLAELRDLLDWRGSPTERGLVLGLRRRLREQFDRGVQVGSDRSKHNETEDSSGENDGIDGKDKRTEGADRRAATQK
jgi:hypothetical protein